MAEPLWRVQQQDQTDKAGYDNYYLNSRSDAWSSVDTIQQHLDRFSRDIRPYYLGGNTKGYVRGLAITTLLSRAQSLGRPLERIRILDAGCGEGLLSVYLADIGFDVIGVDISESAVELARHGAQKLGVGERCLFLAESLEQTSIDTASIDFVIGHASLHHFIKYPGVPAEFRRIMKPGAEGFFADSFSENFLYHIFQNRQQMHQLGDVRLTKALIEEYFSGFSPKLVPTDWFVMLDKLFIKVLPRAMQTAIVHLSKLNFALDRRIPLSSRAFLWMSGAVLTTIQKPGCDFTVNA